MRVRTYERPNPWLEWLLYAAAAAFGIGLGVAGSLWAVNTFADKVLPCR